MFYLLFGAIWLSVIIILTVTFSLGGMFDMVTEEAGMFWIYPFFGLFWIIGLITFGMGLKKVLENYMTNKKGEDCIGRIKELNPTNMYVNGRAVLEAVVIYFKESENMVYEKKEQIGTNSEKYPINSFVKIKEYKDDINLKEKIEDISTISDSLKEKLGYIENYMVPEYNDANPDVITMNGITYRREK